MMKQGFPPTQGFLMSVTVMNSGTKCCRCYPHPVLSGGEDEAWIWPCLPIPYFLLFNPVVSVKMVEVMGKRKNTGVRKMVSIMFCVFFNITV